MIKIKINSSRLGNVHEVISMLNDLNNAYNNLYLFNLIIDSLQQRNNDLQRLDEALYPHYRDWHDKLPPNIQRDMPEYYFFGIHRAKSELLHSENFNKYLNSLDPEKLVYPKDILRITKINIQSPGWWEVFGKLNPLEQIREYLKDRHERIKDNKYRSRQEEEIKDLEILEKENGIIAQRIELLKKMGYTELEIRPIVLPRVIEPLRQLGEHQYKGLIGDAETVKSAVDHLFR